MKALQGASRLLSVYGVDVLEFEYAPPLLRAVGHSDPTEMLRFLHGYGYRIRWGQTVIEPAQFASFTARVMRDPNTSVDLIAEKLPRRSW